MKVIFLDMDGVCNAHEKNNAGHYGTSKSNVAALNRILHCVPEAKIIISSAWRYMIHNGDMTLKGFEYLLLTHGIDCYNRVIGITDKDPTGPDYDNLTGNNINGKYEEQTLSLEEQTYNKDPKNFNHDAWRENGLRWRVDQIENCIIDLFYDFSTGQWDGESSFVILDDLDLKFSKHVISNFVRTDGEIGLAQEDAVLVIEILNRGIKINGESESNDN